ncbi:hypothetical protein N7462_001286 [Penicillium macrosclerotiorum]|uniref:uncharacterized protein n=1 Tax=Penicillium macrosclerotiorum TaxID=303699 RepID=UPI002548F9AC|nr:uncharacterized protein N7462_001286 [Penicillium macrosclerotiorum]KAJ5691863.1 hypothetical protein N7462_001286 [Penicillium macrosclerotiorum]
MRGMQSSPFAMLSNVSVPKFPKNQRWVQAEHPPTPAKINELDVIQCGGHSDSSPNGDTGGFQMESLLPASPSFTPETPDYNMNVANIKTPDSIPVTFQEPSRFPLPENESALVRHFMRTLAPWFDSCNLHRHFTNEVSARLSSSTVLLEAVLAMAAHHLSAIGQLDSLAAEKYYETAKRHLLPSLGTMQSSPNAETLAATIILRLRTELDTPLRQITNKSTLFAEEPLVAEYALADIFFPTPLTPFNVALLWIGLRQELRVAVLGQRIARFPTDCLHVDWHMPPTDDGDWANRMVLNLVAVLQYCYNSPRDVELYKLLTERCQIWRESNPHSFTPMFLEPAGGTSRSRAASSSTMQLYWNLCKIILALHHPTTLLRPGDAAVRREVDQIINQSIRKLCGIGLYNSDCACAVGLACVGIRLWGHRFEDAEDQKALQKILHMAEEKHGLKT